MIVDTSAQKIARLAIECDGIRVNGQPCDNAIDVTFPVRDESTGKVYASDKTRISRGFALLKPKGWRMTKGKHECPRVHGFI